MAATPFDLNPAVQNWRRSLAVSPAFREDNLDELESHLRDSVATLREAGLAPEEAFLVATRRLGSVEAVAAEFAKVQPGDERRCRAGWMTLGVVLWCAVHDLAQIASGAFCLGGHALDLGGLALGWMSIGIQGLVLVLAAMVFLRFAFSDQPLAPGSGLVRSLGPVRLAGLAIIAMLALRLASLLVPVAMAQTFGPSTLGAIYAVQPGPRVFEQAVFIALAAILITRLVVHLRTPVRLAPALLVAAVFGTGLLASPPAQAQTTHLRTLAAAATEPASLARALDLWQAGKKDEALEQFMAVDFSRRPLFPKGSVLAYSEREYMALPRAVNEKLQPEVLAQMGPLKTLATHVKDSAQAARARGDTARADACLAQLRRCGDALVHKDSLAILQAVGRAFQRMGTNAPAAPSRPR